MKTATKPQKTRGAGLAPSPVSGQAWSASKAEELIAAVYLCAGLLAWGIDLQVAGWLCVAKALLGIIFSARESIAASEQTTNA